MYMKGLYNPDLLLKNPFTILGAMSGTSCDGLDLAIVDFTTDAHQKVTYQFRAAETIPFPPHIAAQLAVLTTLGTADLLAFDVVLGKWMGAQMQQFIQRAGVSGVMAVASHGHTVYHQPARGFTLQIGSGAHIQAAVGLPVVCDFRTQDVALGGQGAPLVPIGDQLLFSAFDGCLNLGGFSNLSFQNGNATAALDICAVNVVLNAIAAKTGKTYDAGGAMAQAGRVCLPLLEALQNIEFYQRPGPKSLGTEWVAETITPLLTAYEKLSTNDLLCTYTEHAALQMAAQLRHHNLKNILATGGGVFNSFLMQRLESHYGHQIEQANTTLINFKEALIFALLGYLKLQGKINVLASCTGSSRNHAAGVIYR